MDVDGTLTDGKVYMGDSGEAFKAFNIKDGCGIKEILPKHAIIPIVITARESQMLGNRCNELGIKEIHQGVREKLVCLQSIIDEYSSQNKKYDLSNVAYIGDDLLDLKCLMPIKEAGGLTGCPADSIPEVISICDFVSPHNGGDGAVRDFIEYIVQASEIDSAKMQSRISEAVTYIQNLEFNKLKQGKYEVNDYFYYNVIEYEPQNKDKSFFESHKNHIDIQWIFGGIERLFITDIKRLKAISYDSQKDIYLYESSDSQSSFILQNGSCAILMPNDAHRAEKISDTQNIVKKIVGKISIE